jgi:hypothetical protein
MQFFLLVKYFVSQSRSNGTEAVRQYRREYDERLQKFKDHPLHDWCSNPADGLRYVAVAWKQNTLPEEKIASKYPLDRTIDEIVGILTKARKKREQ